MRSLTLNRRQAQLLRDLRIPDRARLLERHASHQLRQIAATRDRAAAPERLELDVVDRVGGRVDADLQLHDVAAGGCADEPGSDIRVVLRHGADVARVGVVVEDFFVVGAALGWLVGLGDGWRGAGQRLGDGWGGRAEERSA